MSNWGQDSKFVEIYANEGSRRIRDMEEAVRRLEQPAACAAAVEALYHYAHSIKGMSAMMGYTEPAALAAQLEQELRELHQEKRSPKPADVVRLREDIAWLGRVMQAITLAPASVG